MQHNVYTIMRRLIISSRDLITGLQADAANQPRLTVSSARKGVHGIGLSGFGCVNGLSRTYADAGIALSALFLLPAGSCSHGGLGQEAGQPDPRPEFGGYQ